MVQWSRERETGWNQGGATWTLAFSESLTRPLCHPTSGAWEDPPPLATRAREARPPGAPPSRLQQTLQALQPLQQPLQALQLLQPPAAPPAPEPSSTLQVLRQTWPPKKGRSHVAARPLHVETSTSRCPRSVVSARAPRPKRAKPGESSAPLGSFAPVAPQTRSSLRPQLARFHPAARRSRAPEPPAIGPSPTRARPCLARRAPRATRRALAAASGPPEQAELRPATLAARAACRHPPTRQRNKAAGTPGRGPVERDERSADRARRAADPSRSDRVRSPTDAAARRYPGRRAHRRRSRNQTRHRYYQSRC